MTNPSSPCPTLQGIDVPGVTAWYTANIDGALAPLSFEKLPGGHSNFTYRVTDGAGAVTVLRRPPEGELLPSAHDMGREFRVIDALGPTPVPVAPTYGFAEDESVTGAKFYVMGYVEGEVLHDDEIAAEVTAESDRHLIGIDLAETLAKLHAVDIDAVGLGDLGKHENYVARQMRRWYGQYQASEGSVAAIDDLHDRLQARLPAQQGTAIVHGDYRLGNTMTGADGTVAAILDWEICTLGDPLADLGYLLSTWAEPGEASTRLIGYPSLLPGFPTRGEMIDAYSALSDLDLGEIEYYIAFSHWKLACINQGVWYRYDQGQKSTVGVDVEGIRESIEQLAGMAVEAFDRFD
ncbi:MAG: phosphotransferase family protein [Actinomycetia bacterium]|nr:phosphotransferase family protein [Actinomycetes bacterium]